MTAKEALEKLWFHAKEDLRKQDNLYVEYLGDYLQIKQALTELEELKRYPTSEEVCEAIQSELPYGTVKYIEGNQEFVFINHGEQSNITDVYGDRYKVIGFYKSSTLSLIGRFYEGVEKK